MQSDRWPGTAGVFFLSPVYPTVGCAAISEMKSGAFSILKRRPFATFAHLLKHLRCGSFVKYGLIGRTKLQVRVSS